MLLARLSNQLGVGHLGERERLEFGPVTLTSDHGTNTSSHRPVHSPTFPVSIFRTTIIGAGTTTRNPRGGSGHVAIRGRQGLLTAARGRVDATDRCLVP